MNITVKELHNYLEQLIEEGKGDYETLCEGGSVPLGIFDDTVDDERKRVVF